MNGSPMDAIHDDLAAGKTVLLDGGTGTELERRGATMHPKVWCATATKTHPEVLRAVHEDYIRAGARIITTNTYSSSRTMLNAAGIGELFTELNSQAVQLALDARANTNTRDTVAVAGSMSHQIPVLPGQDRRDPKRVPPPEVINQNARAMAELLADAIFG